MIAKSKGLLAIEKNDPDKREYEIEVCDIFGIIVYKFPHQINEMPSNASNSRSVKANSTTWDLSRVNEMLSFEDFFKRYKIINVTSPLLTNASWDVSNVTNMSNMFRV